MAESNKKIVVFVPIDYADKIRQVIGEVGGGKIGKYSFCSFSSKGIGRFKPEEGANPAIGSIGKIEEVEEERIEFVCPENLVSQIISAIKAAHPYEEMALDVYSLDTVEEQSSVGSRKILTLCIPHKGHRVLLAMKKRGFGMGRWNGMGGKLKEGETVEEAARREVLEEAGIDIQEMKELGVIEFSWQNRPDILEVHVFKATSFTGEPVETDEMSPQWFGVDEIPFDQMWSDDRYWFDHFLAGRQFWGKFVFDDLDQVVEQEVREVATVE